MRGVGGAGGAGPGPCSPAALGRFPSRASRYTAAFCSAGERSALAGLRPVRGLPKGDPDREQGDGGGKLRVLNQDFALLGAEVTLLLARFKTRILEGRLSAGKT